ncbi:hydroxymethylbilane synthase [Georgenia thermotolerans]|uniref:Porphobilinogen deaminase n=1 Tax=Georgenia thermotolerans TaxID=527326 RepID=A0A7J5UKU4_9MICO|nr:hydroxymethylbilane synthase [Georgenia thermotolerans]KAE8763015.1 hydroxymethylbilane synthase [Georgenia thermotolerans]
MSTSTPPLRVGTRGSELALTQTSAVADTLAVAAGREVELVRIRTEGDRSTASLASLGGTGVFAAALREALLAGACDVAVHSLKDLPTAPTPGLSIGALPVREDHRDVLCAREGWTLATLPAGARVGTGSPRRAAQLRLARPDIDVVDIRGNVGTRLARVEADLDAVVLARAGLARLGLLDKVTDTLDPDVMLSAPGQGALAVECRTPDLTGPLGEALRAIDDLPTRLAVVAERALLATLEAGCAAPVAAWAHVVPATDATPARLELRGGAFDPAGTQGMVRTGGVELPGLGEGTEDPGNALGQDVAVSLARELGEATAAELLDAGAAAIAGLPTPDDVPAPDLPGVLDGADGADARP